MHENTGQIGPVKGFPEEERKHAIPLTDDEHRQAMGMNRKQRRAFARTLRNRAKRRRKRS